MKTGAIGLLVFACVLLAGCGSYAHKIGNCVVRGGNYKVVAEVWRKEGRPDAPGRIILARACEATP